MNLGGKNGSLQTPKCRNSHCGGETEYHSLEPFMWSGIETNVVCELDYWILKTTLGAN